LIIALLIKTEAGFIVGRTIPSETTPIAIANPITPIAAIRI